MTVRHRAGRFLGYVSDFTAKTTAFDHGYFAVQRFELQWLGNRLSGSLRLRSMMPKLYQRSLRLTVALSDCKLVLDGGVSRPGRHEAARGVRVHRAGHSRTEE